MKPVQRLLLIAALASSGLGFSGGRPTPTPDPTETPPPFSHPSFKKILIVVLENTNASEALKQPFLSQLARQGAYFDSFYAVTHPSQPNYIAMTAGTYYGVKNDKNVTLDVKSIADLLEKKGMTWKAYAAGYPGGCFLGAKAGNYRRKHIPFLSFKGIQNDPERCKNVVDEKALQKDIDQGTIPAFSLYVPDMDDDGHDTDVAYADRWLSTEFGPKLKDPRFMKDLLFVVTFDEGTLSGPNRIYTVLYGDSVIGGKTTRYPYNFYNLLRTVEETFTLGTLNQKDSSAIPISGVWK